MQILVAIVVVACLWSVDCFSDESPEQLMAWRLVLVVSCMISVPVLAMLQSACLVEKLRTENSINRHNFAQWINFANGVHTFAWLLACFVIFAIARWGSIVRGNWNLDQMFLVDELLIIAPVLLPLVASWFFFFELSENYGRRKQDENSATARRKRQIRYCLLRCQIYIALTLIPMMVLWAANDLTKIFVAPENTWAKWVIMGSAFGMATIFFPWLLMCVWPNRKVRDSNILGQVKSICLEKRIRVSDVRIWKTGNQVTNAMVAGFVWPCRIVWLSDALLEMLNPQELDTVLRHEMGHARRRHLAMRLFFMMLPVAASAFLLACFPQQVTSWAERLTFGNLSGNWILSVVLPSLGISYLIIVVGWLSHNIEKDADVEACLATVANSGGHQLCAERVEVFKSALMKIGATIPGGVDRQTLMHPSILERSQFLSKLVEDPAMLTEFRRQFLMRRLLLLSVIVITFGLLIFC